MIQILPHGAPRKKWRMETIHIEPPPGYTGARIMLSEPDAPDDPIELPTRAPDGRKRKEYGQGMIEFVAAAKEMKRYFTSADFQPQGFTSRNATNYLARLVEKKLILRTNLKRKSKQGRPAWVFMLNPASVEIKLRGAVVPT